MAGGSPIAPALAADGRWRIVALVETTGGGTEVPLTTPTRRPPTRITVQRTPGLPTIYTITIGSRHVQALRDPARPGLNQVHFTYVDGAGHPSTPSSRGAGPPRRRAPMTLTLRRLEIGHYVADAELTPGAWTFKARAADGFEVSFEETVRS